MDAISSSVTPTPSPAPLPRETYKVEKDINGTDVCILMKAAISVEVMYPISENKTVSLISLVKGHYI